MDWPEAYGVEIGVDAAIAVENQISHEVGTEDWVSESQEIANECWVLRESFCDIAFAASVRDHLESVVLVLLIP